MVVPVLFLEAASGHSNAVAPTDALKTAKQLVKALRDTRRANTKISLNSNTHIGDCELAPGQTLRMVLGGHQYREEWTFIRELATRSPFSSGLEEWIASAELADATPSNGQSSVALTWANLLETGTISFHVQPDWLQPWITADCITLDADCNETSCKRDIRNISASDHVEVHKDWLEVLGRDQCPDSKKLWSERDSRFSGLRFLARVEDELSQLATSGAPFRQALNCLEALNQDAVVWGGNGIPKFSVKVADGEHDRRRSLSKFTDEVSGETFEFDRHAYFTGGIAGRIHFRLSSEESKFVIAHVGFKL